jgi:catalase
MPETDVETYKWNPFDLTKVWPHRDYPLIEVGDLELNRNPEDYFAEVEQAAFAPSSCPASASVRTKYYRTEFSLMRRASAPHRHQLSPDPCQSGEGSKVHPYHRDGSMVTGNNGGGSVDFEPNSFGGPGENMAMMEPPLKIDGTGGRYITHPGDDNDLYGQPPVPESVLDDKGRVRLVATIVASMTEPAMDITDNVKRHEIQQRMMKHRYKVHPDFGAAVDKGIGRAREDMEWNDANRRRLEMVGLNR